MHLLHTQSTLQTQSRNRPPTLPVRFQMHCSIAEKREEHVRWFSFAKPAYEWITPDSTVAKRFLLVTQRASPRLPWNGLGSCYTREEAHVARVEGFKMCACYLQEPTMRQSCGIRRSDGITSNYDLWQNAHLVPGAEGMRARNFHPPLGGTFFNTHLLYPTLELNFFGIRAMLYQKMDAGNCGI